MKKTSKQMERIDDYYIEASISIKQNDFEALKQKVTECPECVQYDKYRETLLHLAAEKGTPEMIEFLYHSGGDINKVCSEIPPICNAVMKNKVDNIKMLLKLGVKLDSETSVANPLLYTVSVDYNKEHKTEIAKLLIDAGIDLTIQYATRDDIWWDALSFARYYHAEEIAEMILEKLKKDGIDYDSIVPLTDEDFEDEEDEEEDFDDEEEDFEDEEEDEEDDEEDEEDFDDGEEDDDGDEVIDMEEYYEKYLGEIDTTYDGFDMQKQIYGEVRILSDIDLSIEVIMPDKNRNYITLVTLGMCEYAMAETADGLKFAELMMKLPPDWDVSEEALSDMTKNWPFRMLLKTAHLAHRLKGKYVDETTVMPSGNPNDAILYFDGDTELSSVMLCRSEDIPSLEVDEEITVDFFTLIPITEGEGELVKKTSSEAVKKKLPKGEIVDMEREYLA